MDIRKIVNFIIENWAVISLVGGSAFAVFTRWQGKKVRTADVIKVITDFALEVHVRAAAEGVTVKELTEAALPAEIASKTSRTLEQAANVFSIDPMTGKPVVDKQALAVEIAKSGDFKKLAKKFKKWIKKV